MDAFVGVDKILSAPLELARLEGGVGDSGVLMCPLVLGRLPMFLSDSSSTSSLDSSSVSDLARESKNMSIIGLTGLATRMWRWRGFLGEYSGERKGGRERFVVASRGRKGPRATPGEDGSFWGESTPTLTFRRPLTGVTKHLAAGKSAPCIVWQSSSDVTEVRGVSSSGSYAELSSRSQRLE